MFHYTLRRVKYILILLLLIVLSLLLLQKVKRASIDVSPISPTVSNMSVFEYIINHNVCEENNSTRLAVMLVMSSVANLKVRNMIREAYPAEELNKLGIRRLFVLAKLAEDFKGMIQYWIVEEEGAKHSDILLINNPESVPHLGYRTLMGLKYAALFCSDVSFVIKTDESVFYDVYQLIDILKAVPEENRDIIFGTRKTMSIQLLRDVGNLAVPDSYSSEKETPNDSYLSYVSFLLYFTSTKTAGVLVETSSLVPYLKIEEVFVTGLVAQEAGVPRKDIGGELSYGKSLHCCQNNEENIVYKCHYLAAYVDEKILGKTQRRSEYCFRSKNCTRLSGAETAEKLECF